MTVTLTQDNQTYWPGGTYSATNGVWNQGSLVNGTGYTQTISIDETRFPDGVTMNWSWPAGGNGSVYAYPEISWGVDGHVIQLADLLSLESTFDFRISGNLGGFNVAFDIWLYPDARGIWETTTNEVMLWLHSNGWTPEFESRFTSGAYSAGLEIDPNWGDLSGDSPHTWQYIAAIPDQDMLSGTISLSDLFKDLIWKGLLSGREYLRTVEVGAETMEGAGSLHVADLSYAETRKTSVGGTAGDDTFTAGPVGYNHIVAGAGVDTVVYSGQYADYDVQARSGDVLVRGAGDISTLDILEGVEKVRFADGVYDAASRSFGGTGASAVMMTGNPIDGSAGGDVLFGTAASDYMRGLDGNDQLEGAGGDDDVNGNVGADTVYGGDGADWVRGGRDNDFIDGGPGADPHVNGNLGDDTVRGGIGADTVYGGQGADRVFGDAGDDLLSGDLGADLLTGGSGADRFAIARGGGFDWVADFRPAEGDRVQLASGTAYSLSTHEGQLVVDLGGGDKLGLAGVAPTGAADWLVFA